jgi:hypothetical protein
MSVVICLPCFHLIDQFDVLENQLQNVRDNLAAKYVGTNRINKQKSPEPLPPPAATSSNSDSDRKPLMNNHENLVSCTGSVYSNRTNKANNHNILIPGDRHLWGSAIRIGGYLGEKFEVSGMIKPGASVTDIVAQTNMNYRSLTKNDVIVLHGRSSDVYSVMC